MNEENLKKALQLLEQYVVRREAVLGNKLGKHNEIVQAIELLKSVGNQESEIR